MYFNKFTVPKDITSYFRDIVDRILIKNNISSISDYSEYSTVNADQFLLYDFRLELNEIVKYYESNIFKSKLDLHQCWTVYGREGSFQTIHQHSSEGEYVENSNDICTVLYLKTNNDCYPNSCFYAFNPYKNDIIEHLPNTGDLIVFSPNIWHGAYPQGKGLRQTLNIDFGIINS